MNEAEKRAEALLESLGQELYRQRIKGFTDFERAQDTGTHDNMYHHNAEHSDDIELIRRKKRRRRLATLAAILCICIITVGTLTVTSDAFRAKVFGFLFVKQDGHTDMIKVDDTEEQKLVIRYPEYLPPGYQLVDKEDYGDMCVLTYSNEDTDDFISITQTTDANISMSIDNETSVREKCIVGIYEAYYISGNENHILMWDEDGIFYEITSVLDKEALIHIAEQLE